MTTDQGPEARVARLAAAVLGGGRAAALRDELVERARQIALVERADPGDEAIGFGPAAAAPARPAPPVGPARWSPLGACLERIAALDGHLRAWAALAPRPQGATGARAGREGAEAAVPVVGVKDVIDVAALPTAAGLGAPLRTPVADAPVVGRARRAGAAIVGKTMTTPWALNDPAPTFNPWNRAHTPGGSSAGSAVAVAAGMCDATIDTQTAGDVLRPAAYNGVVGFKPSAGWVTTAGCVPVAWSIDTVGIIGGDVARVAALYRLLRPAGQSAPGSGSLGWRPSLAVLRDPLLESCSEAVRRGTDDVAAQLAAEGATVESVASPVDLATVHAAHRIVTFVECATFHARRAADAEAYPPRARALVELGLATPASTYVAAQRVRAWATSRLGAVFERHDAVLLPTATSSAPAGRSSTGDSSLQIPWTLCGNPAVSLPVGLDGHGLPAAVQVVGPLGGDAAVLAVAAWCEASLGVALPRPPASLTR